jgi:hypothetical protein
VFSAEHALEPGALISPAWERHLQECFQVSALEDDGIALRAGLEQIIGDVLSQLAHAMNVVDLEDNRWPLDGPGATLVLPELRQFGLDLIVLGCVYSSMLTLRHHAGSDSALCSAKISRSIPEEKARISAGGSSSRASRTRAR